jgi:hypothetical protein
MMAMQMLKGAFTVLENPSKQPKIYDCQQGHHGSEITNDPALME